MPMIDVTKWGEFYKGMTDGLKPYDHYDDGYKDAMDNVDDWMDGNQVEAEPVRYGRWMCGDYYDIGDVCSECDWDSGMVNPTLRYCPNCGADMRGDSDE